MHYLKYAALSGVASLALITQPSFAQESSSAPAPEAAGDQAAGIADIVVTAERRTESLQRTALAVSAVTGEDLVKTGVTDAAGIGRLVPALQYSQREFRLCLFPRTIVMLPIICARQHRDDLPKHVA